MPYIGIAVGCIALMILYVYMTQRSFQFNTYTVSYPKELPGAEQVPKRIMVLSDLHNHEYGEKNRILLQTIADARPDMILIPGDMMVCGSPKHWIATEFAGELMKLGIPTYYSYGNHEHRFSEDDPEEFAEYAEKFTSAGVRMLNNESTEPIPGVSVVGLTIPRSCYRKGVATTHISVEDIGDLLGDGDPNKFVIMLAHNPVYFEEYAKYGANLVVSGHMHGGIMRLPGLGGVVSPQWRLFPKYDAGIFRNGNCVMAVSRGLGVHTIPVRFFNKPELMLLEITVE